MADKKISALPAATTPLAGTEVLPIVQGGTTDQVSVANLTAGRAVSATGYTATNGGFTSSSGGVHRSNSAAESDSISNLFYAQNAAGNKAINLQLSSTNLGSVWAYNGSSWFEGWTVDTSGNLKLPANNLVIGTAGKGIDFSANSHGAGMTSELLNWYEEGTFTPTFTGLTVGNGSVFGYYRRVGKQVFVTYGFITGSTSAVGALTGVSGFPFTTGSVGGSRFFPVTGVAFEGGVGWYGAASAIFTSATSGIGVFSPTNNTGFSATVPFTWGADDSVSLTATYFVD